MNKYRILAVLLTSLILVSCATGTSRDERSVQAIQTDSWALPILGGYRSTFDDGVHLIEKRNSKGAFHLSSMVKGSAVDEAELLRVATMQISGRAELRPTTRTDFPGYKATFREGQVIWMNWYFAIDQSLIFMTYNVDASMLDKEETLEILRLVDGLFRIVENATFL